MKWKQMALTVILAVIMFYSAIALGKQIQKLKGEQDDFKNLKSRIVNAQEESGGKPAEIADGQEKDMLPEYREIYQENQDFCGWIRIEGTQIDYPVMQKVEDREFYLHRDFYGKDSYAGVPFVGNGDIRGDTGDLFVYGHNMKNGTMFADLLNYRNEEYWKGHSVIQLDTLWEHREYEIFTAFYAEEDDWSKEDGMFCLEINGMRMNRKAYLEKLKKVGFYETETILKKDNPLIFLVTCSYQKKAGRLVVVGRLKNHTIIKQKFQ